MEEQVQYVTTKEVACDGGNGRLGHPRVYLNLSKENLVVCPYCSKKYVYQINKISS